MYNNSETKTLIASGPVYFKNLSDDGKFVYVADVGKLEISQSVETKELKSGRAGKGAKLKALSRLKDVKAKITFNEINAKALEIALRAGVTDIASATVTDEVLEDVGIDCLSMFAFVPDKSETVTVKNSAGDVTYVLGTDYELESVGIVPKAGGAIVAEQDLKVSYKKEVSSRIQALINSGKEYALTFCGTNEAESDKKFTLLIHRITFTPASNISFISEDFATLECEGDILADGNKPLYEMIEEK